MATHPATRDMSGPRTSDGAARPAVEYDADALQTRRRPPNVGFVEQLLINKTHDRRTSRGVRIARLPRTAARPQRLRRRAHRQEVGRHQDRCGQRAYCRCTNAAIASSSRSPDPANLQALDEVRFKTNLVIDPVVVEDDKLGQTIAKLAETMERSSRTRHRQRSRDRSRQCQQAPQRGGEPGRRRRTDRRAAIQKVLLDAIGAGVSGHSLRALREVLPDPLPSRRRDDRGRATAARNQRQGRLADQGDFETRHLREASAAGRPHEARAVEEPGRSISGSALCRRCTARSSCCGFSIRPASSSASRCWATSPTSSNRSSPRSTARTG